MRAMSNRKLHPLNKTACSDYNSQIFPNSAQLHDHKPQYVSMKDIKFWRP